MLDFAYMIHLLVAAGLEQNPDCRASVLRLNRRAIPDS